MSGLLSPAGQRPAAPDAAERVLTPDAAERVLTPDVTERVLAPDAAARVLAPAPPGPEAAPAPPPPPLPPPRGRRRVFLGLVGLVTLVLVALGWRVLSAGGWTGWEAALFLCLALNAPWMGLSAATGLIGTALRLGRRDPSAAVLPTLRGLPAEAPITARTLLALCVRNDDMAEVLPPLDRLLRALNAAGHAGHFAIGVLSDTSDPEHIVAEAAAVAALAAAHPPSAVLYRRRPSNDGFKAGNVMQFLDHHAPGFEWMLLLDADSTMLPGTVLRLVRIAQADPRLALLQPTVAGRPASAPFGRLFGFGHRHGSRVWATGQAWWQNEQGPFWGHNALLRIAPFRAHCRLGRLPDGSHILSHDHVEAARLHGAGWAVRVLPEDAGSQEAHPPHLLAFLRRDLRWAAGNLQYRWLLRDPALGRLGRFQMLQAIAHYALTPLWFGMLPLAALNAATGGGAGTPRGPLLLLLGLGLLCTHLPKLGGYAEALLRPGAAAPPGPMLRELAFTAVFDPIAAFDKTLTVLKLLAGRGRGWPAQERLERPVPWREAIGAFWPHTAVGAALLALFAAAGVVPLLLALPFTAGLLLTVPFCVLTAQPGPPPVATDPALPRGDPAGPRTSVTAPGPTAAASGEA